jgi:D-aminoacyl-tRNA deacylase
MGPVRAVVSRVASASVTVEGAVVGEIGRGLLTLVGAGRDDDADRARALARKVHDLRVFRTDDGARSAGDLGLPVLVVSQFTSTPTRGRAAAPPGPTPRPVRWPSRWWRRSSPSCAAGAPRWRPACSAPGCRSPRSTTGR